ncbi:hypothetical protein ACFE04_020568 [Oxalis oulophora]
MPPPLQLLLLLFLFLNSSSSAATVTNSTTTTTTTEAPSPSPTPTTHSSSLDPKQLKALQSLNLPTQKPNSICSQPTTTCDLASPFRHLLTLQLLNCSDDVSLSFTALKSLSTLQNLSFINCPIAPIRFPSELSLNLHSFIAVNSLRHLTGVWLSRLVNLTDLTVTNVEVNTSGLYVILGNMEKLKTVTISQANLTGSLPKHIKAKLTHIDFSGNQLKGNIPSSLIALEDLESLNLESNSLDGEMPLEFGDLISLKNLSLAYNSFSGSIPESMAAIPDLVHIDLSNNQLNGTIPRYLADMKGLKYLSLAHNQLHGILPFNASFLKRLEVFKVNGNSDLCYNHTNYSPNVKLGISPCDKHGLPMSPPPAKDSSGGGGGGDSDNNDYGDDSGNDTSKKEEHHHGPSKIVLGLAIGLSSIVFLIVFLVLLSKWCG